MTLVTCSSLILQVFFYTYNSDILSYVIEGVHTLQNTSLCSTVCLSVVPCGVMFLVIKYNSGPSEAFEDSSVISQCVRSINAIGV